MSGEDEDWLTTVLRSDATVMRLARETFHERGGGDEGTLAARRHLDEELRAMTRWPRGEDYERIAADCEASGRTQDAALLREVARADALIAETGITWNRRYVHRPLTRNWELAGQMTRGGHVDFDPDGPYHGTDGALYRPGMLGNGLPETPILILAGRGTTEFMLGWADYESLMAWVAGRGTTASGALAPPPVQYGRGSRAWREDIVLGYLVGRKREVPLVDPPPPETFTTDVRYDLYLAFRNVHRSGQAITQQAIAAELVRRMARVPDDAVSAYGGRGAPWAHAYLARLESTPVIDEEAFAAEDSLRLEDSQDVRHDARPSPSATEAAARGQRRTAEALARPGTQCHGL
jgi:hypothetical protein